MKKVLSLLLCFCLMLALAACFEVDVIEDYDFDPPLPKGKYTIMVYLNGTDLETKHGMASGDLKEMIDAEYNLDEVRVVVQTGGAKLWWSTGIPDAPARFLVTDTGAALLEELEPQSMVDPNTLTDFINFGMDNFPADRYGLIMWNHGGGSVWGYGSDEYDAEEDEMVLGELKQAMQNSRAAQQKLEFVGFDACLMATLETAYIMKDYAKYFIASEELEPGYGWDFDNFLSILGDEPDMPGDELGRVIVDSFVAYYNDNGMEKEATTLSLVDLSKVGATVKALDDFIAVANMKNYQYQEIAQPRAGTKEFGFPVENGYSCEMVDIIHMAEQFSQLCPAESKALIQAVNNAVLYKSQSDFVEHAGGLSLYFPYTEKDMVPRRMEVYRTSGFSPNYINFATEFANALCGTTLAPLDNVADYMPEQPTADNFDIFLSGRDLANLSRIYFTAWMHLSGDAYMQLYQNTDVNIAADGRVTTEYDGTYTTIGGNAACLYEIERGNGYIRYAAPATLQKKGWDYTEEVNIIVLADAQNPDGLVLGAVPMGGGEYGRQAPKETLAIEKGDEIAFHFWVEEFENIGAGGSYDGPYWSEGESFTVGNDFKVEVWDVEPGSYLYGFTLMDLQGNSYYTDFIEMEIYYE